MSAGSDPYHRWLGIPPEEQPADHYRLLGLARFEDDPEVIRDAAERQMGHVRHYALGQYRDLSQRILNELGAAKACLLNSEKKARYDAGLRAAGSGPSPPEPPPAETETEWQPTFVPVTPTIRPTKRATPRRGRVAPTRKAPKTSGLQITRKHLLIGGIAAGVVLLVGTVLAFFFSGQKGATEKGRFVAAGEGESSEAPLGTKGTANPGSENGTPASKPDGPSEGEKPTEKSDLAEPEGTKETIPSPPPTASATKPEAKPEPESEPEPKVEPAVKPKPEPNLEPPKVSNSPPLAIAPFDGAQARRHQEAWAKHLGTQVEITNSIGMRFVLIPPGEFEMGSPEGDLGLSGVERPQHTVHTVRITKPFYLGVTEVTQVQYGRVMDGNPSCFKGDPQRPVEMVSWDDAKVFCRKLSEKEDGTYRLPTEAEWEYACRAGTTTKWCFGDDESSLPDYAWYLDNANRQTHTVGQKKSNGWGLYDMHGNVWEWCADWFDGQYYPRSPSDDPAGPDRGLRRVYRGGSSSNDASNCRASCRYWLDPGIRNVNLGFRLARTVSFPSTSR